MPFKLNFNNNDSDHLFDLQLLSSAHNISINSEKPPKNPVLGLFIRRPPVWSMKQGDSRKNRRRPQRYLLESPRFL